MTIDQDHLDYWCSYMIPVILVCYSPLRKLASWVSINEYVRNQKSPITHIELPFSKQFNCESLSGQIIRLANSDSYFRNQKDRRFLIECIDNCLVGDTQSRLQGLSILGAHPDSRDSRTTAYLARHLIFDEDLSVSNEAIFILAYHVCRFRWSFNPNSSELKDLMCYASALCHDFTADDCRRLIERVDNEWFRGPHAMGERVFDLLMCCELSHQVLEEMASNKDLPIQRRINSLYMLYGCDVADLLDFSELADDPNVGDVYREMYPVEVRKRYHMGL